MQPAIGFLVCKRRTTTNLHYYIAECKIVEAGERLSPVVLDRPDVMTNFHSKRNWYVFNR